MPKMNRKPLQHRRFLSTSLGGRRARPRIRLGVEPLEPRQLLACDVPVGITVGRTLSSWTAAGIQGNPLRITYSVYNEQDTEVSDVRLTTTLAPNVSFVTASAVPTQTGRELTWSVGKLVAHGRASIEVTVG